MIKKYFTISLQFIADLCTFDKQKHNEKLQINLQKMGTRP
jgi:hypothetical protein